MLTELWKRIDLNNEHFNKELAQSEMNNQKLKQKNVLEWMNSRLSDREERISGLEDRIMEITQSEQQKEKQILKKMKAT